MPSDEAHGRIHGALGTMRHDEAPRRSWRRRALTLLAIIGPGLIVMVGDNDAGGVSTYAQAGQNFGLSLLWTLPLLIPVLIVNQEMVVRLGAVCGVGHARLINERFGRFWGAFSVGDLFVLNFLTIVTEFIGVSLALGYFGVSPYISVPLAALGLVAMTATGSFRRWERFMLVFIVANFLVIPLAVYAHPHAGPVFKHFVTPGVAGGFNSTSVLLIIAIVGTTVAPWQLFFQQSNIVDKRITPRWINYERVDTVLGSLITVLAASLIIITVAFAFAHTHAAGRFTNAGGVAHELDHYLGNATGTLFSIILLNASIIGAAAVTLSTSYAFGDIFGTRHSLNRRVRDAKFFYATFTGIVAAAGGDRPDPRGPPRAHHHRSTGAGRDPPPERHGLPAPAVQRQGGARAVGEPPLAQYRVDVHHLGVVRAVPHPDDHDGVPPYRCARAPPGPVHRARASSSSWRGCCTCGRSDAGPAPTPASANGA